jgi:hypothetical protein
LGFPGVSFQFGEFGNYTITASYFSETHLGFEKGPNFQFSVDNVNVQISDEKLSWISPSSGVYQGDAVHLGFSTVESKVKYNRVQFLILENPSMTPYTYSAASCSPGGLTGLSIEIHTDGKSIEWENDPPRTNTWPQQEMALGASTIEYYKNHQPLKTLNNKTIRHPIRVDPLNISNSVMPPFASATASYDPPESAKYAVVVYNTEAIICSNRVWMSRAWTEFSLTNNPAKVTK